MSIPAIVIPVYHKAAPFIAEHLRRFRLFLRAPYYVIVMDDHTTDGTYENLQELCKDYPELKLFRNPVNRGWGAKGILLTMMEGLQIALTLDASWVLRMDHDSLLLQSGLESDVESAFNSDSRIGLLGTIQPSREVSYIWRDRLPGDIKQEAKENGYLNVLHGLVWNACSGGLVFRREMIEAWERLGWLSQPPIRRKWLGMSGVPSDPFFGMYTYGSGFKVLDLPTFRIYYNPKMIKAYTPALLKSLGVKLIHPIKDRATWGQDYEPGNLSDLEKFQ